MPANSEIGAALMTCESQTTAGRPDPSPEIGAAQDRSDSHTPRGRPNPSPEIATAHHFRESHVRVGQRNLGAVHHRRESQSPAGRPNHSSNSDDDAVHPADDSPPRPGPSSLLGAAHKSRESQKSSGRPAYHDLDELIRLAKEWHGRHKWAMRQRNRNNGSTQARIRTLMGWTRELPEEERQAIEKRAEAAMTIGNRYFAAVAKKPETPHPEHPDFLNNELIIAANYQGALPFSCLEDDCKRELEKIGKQLPAADWWCSQLGLSGKQLAEIIGEMGDLSNYPHYRHVWKRLGLAPYEGQTYKNWRIKGGLSAEEWIKAGYSGKRRSLTYNIAESLIKARNAEWRARYDARREYTAITHAEDWLKGQPAKKPDGKWTQCGHANDDAKRIMIKELISALWAEWRRSKVGLDAQGEVAAATINPARDGGERLTVS